MCTMPGPRHSHSPGLLPPPSPDLDVHKWLLTFSNDALELASHVGTNPQVPVEGLGTPSIQCEVLHM